MSDSTGQELLDIKGDIMNVAFNKHLESCVGNEFCIGEISQGGQFVGCNERLLAFLGLTTLEETHFDEVFYSDDELDFAAISQNLPTRRYFRAKQDRKLNSRTMLVVLYPADSENSFGSFLLIGGKRSNAFSGCHALNVASSLCNWRL